MNNKDELYHYGVLGMKWGKRRAISPEEMQKRAAKKEYKTDVKAMKKAIRKDTKMNNMTSKSISTYGNLQTQKGKAYADRVLKGAKSSIRTARISGAAVVAAAAIGSGIVQGLRLKRMINNI